MSTTLIPMLTRVEPELRDEVHDYRRRQETIPAMSEAIRQLIRLGLRASQQIQKTQQTQKKQQT
jgi:hypothetical protein